MYIVIIWRRQYKVEKTCVLSFYHYLDNKMLKLKVVGLGMEGNPLNKTLIK